MHTSALPILRKLVQNLILFFNLIYYNGFMETSSLEFFPLPYLELDSSLRLIYINRIARDVFGDEAVLGKSAEFFLAKTPQEEVNNNSNLNSSFSNENSKEKLVDLKNGLKKLASTCQSANGDSWGEVAILEYWIKKNDRRRVSRSEVIVRYQPEVTSPADCKSLPSPVTSPLESASYNFNLEDAHCRFTILFVKPLKPFLIALPPRAHIPMIDPRYFLPDGATPPAEVGDPMLMAEKTAARNEARDEPMPLLAEYNDPRFMAPILEEASHYKDMIDYLPQVREF